MKKRFFSIFYEGKIRWKYLSIWKSSQKKPSNVIRIVICLTDQLTIMLFENRRGPKRNRKKVGKGLTVEKTVRTKSVNVEMIFKSEIFLRKTKNFPKYQLLRCRMLRNEKVPPNINYWDVDACVWTFSTFLNLRFFFKLFSVSYVSWFSLGFGGITTFSEID